MFFRSFAALLLLSSAAFAQDACPRRGGELTIPFAPDPADVTPGKNAQYAPSLVFDEIYDTLLRMDRKGSLGPGLATKYEVAKDNLSIVFTLRQGVMFHHGREFEAKDVVFTFERLQDPKFASPWAAQLKSIDKVEALDKYTVRMTFKEPFAPILSVVATNWYTAIVPYDFTPANNLNQKASGTGPFELVEYVPDDHVTLKRNPNYWEKGKPYIDSVVFALIPDPQQRRNALARGEIDWMWVEPAQVPAAEAAAKGGGFRVIEIKTNAPERAVVDFNMRREPMKNLKVRQALFQAIDRDRVVQDVYQGMANKELNAIPAQFRSLHDPSIDYNKIYPYDPKKAGALLDAAGYPLKNGQRFSIELTYPAVPPFEWVARVVQSEWTAIGLSVKMAGLDGQIWTDKVYKRHDFDASIISLTARTNPVLGIDRSYLCNQGSVPYANPTGYCNAELDKLIAEAAATPLDKQRAVYSKYAEMVARDINEITLTNARSFEAVSTKLKNIDAQFNVAFNTHPNWQEVWIPKEQQN